MEFSLFSSRVFSLPYSLPHYITNGEVLNGIPSETFIAPPKGISLTNYRMLPQIDGFHYDENGSEFVGAYIPPWEGEPTYLEGTSGEYLSDYFNFGSLNRPALQLLANDEKIKDSVNEVFQKIDHAISVVKSSSTEYGPIGLAIIEPDSINADGLNNAKTSFGDTNLPNLGGDRTVKRFKDKSISANSYTVNVKLRRPMVKGDKYLIKVESNWAFSQYNRYLDWYSDVDDFHVSFCHANIDVKHYSASVVSLGMVGLTASFNDHYHHKYSGWKGNKHRRSYNGSDMPGEWGGMYVAKNVYTSTVDVLETLPLTVKVSYKGNTLAADDNEVVMGLRNIFITVEAI